MAPRKRAGEPIAKPVGGRRMARMREATLRRLCRLGVSARSGPTYESSPAR